MPYHEKLELPADWHTARPLLQYEHNRVAANVHELREQVHVELLQVAANRDEDNTTHASANSANGVRIAVLETKALFYGTLGGAVGAALLNLLLWKLRT